MTPTEQSEINSLRFAVEKSLEMLLQIGEEDNQYHAPFTIDICQKALNSDNVNLSDEDTEPIVDKYIRTMELTKIGLEALLLTFEGNLKEVQNPLEYEYWQGSIYAINKVSVQIGNIEKYLK